jgi:hypothetical protein
MVRRSLPLLSTLLALVLLMLVSTTASAYNNENRYHLRLSRIDPLRCGTWIGVEAKLTDRHGNKVPGKTIHFEIDWGKPGDTVSPANVVTNSRGKAVAYVKLVCVSHLHITQVEATGPNGARARITFVLHKQHDWHHHGYRYL